MASDRNRARPGLSRRTFLRGAGKLGAAGMAVGMLPLSIQRALAIPAARVTGTLSDVEHVVILMQENRSFDHYFGTMSGVRGFSDRTAIPLPGERSVWQQSDGTRDVAPFHLDTQTTTAMRVPGTPHTWPDAQLAWDQGRLGAWPKHKQFQSMGYYDEADIPFQRALADAFTLCDAHHCSVQTGTLPNRVVFMTGTNVTPGRNEPGTDQTHALIDNANNRGLQLGPYTWTTYPERLQAAGVDWRIYQDPEDNWTGLLAPWESFAQYRAARPGEPLYERAMRPWSLAHLRDDVQRGTLPQVCWIIPSPVWSEHPSRSSPLQGGAYTQQVLDILTENPDVWSKTVLLVTFDENDGFFDHVPPPALPARGDDGRLLGATTLRTPIDGQYYVDELAGVRAARPYGMGPRVPMYVVSPWSRGGWVCSQVFDHTSTIRFLEARFGVHEPNISAWHRAVSGDLTRCFDFARPNEAVLPALPDMRAAPSEELVITGLPPVTLPDAPRLPRQARGVRHARALPYVLHCDARAIGAGRLQLALDNEGEIGAVFHVYDRLHLDRPPRRYTVEAGKMLIDAWDARADAGAYDLFVVGPNGFLRRFAGDAVDPVEATLRYVPDAYRIALSLVSSADATSVVEGTSGYASTLPFARAITRGDGELRLVLDVREASGWYDLTVRLRGVARYVRRFAGRLETGAHGITDPALA